ncbi:MAG: ThiF family adenylyltransferase [Rhodoferax sp.]|nr:ThiF family adenylyltransferase [Rhodoferax sp.]
MIIDAFRGDYVTPIEQKLEIQLPGRWRRLNEDELKKQPLCNLCIGWKIDLDFGSVLCKGIDHFVVVVNSSFPHSQPRVLIPQAGINFMWPHVEDKGLLCLEATQLTGDPSERILQHLNWAHELMNYDELKIRREFEREFSSYWIRFSQKNRRSSKILSLMNISGNSREVVYFSDIPNNRIIVADDADVLRKWLKNSNINSREKEFLPSWLTMLPKQWIPSEYPQIGSNLLKFIPAPVLRKILIRGEQFPIFIGVGTPTGQVFAAATLQCAKMRDLTKGFRSISQVPFERIKASFGSRPVLRCSVSRVDGRWVHGRDHDPTFSTMHAKSVAVVGCGALGSSIAKLLAQSGVGSFFLIDGDHLSPANVSRHELGMQCVDKNKAEAMLAMLQQDFPHLHSPKAYPKRFEFLTQKERAEIANADLIITAGIDLDSDVSLDNWRRTLSQPPAHLCTWVEAFAVVGHAVLLYGNDSLMSGFDDTERPSFRLTNWSEDSQQLIDEAGCGNAFQPHGVVDLHSTVTLAARFAVDTLSGKIPSSCRRVWQGDLREVSKNGGVAMPNFSESWVIKEFPW